eukprot:354987-Chlamydomonas_euryale.AAC.4
MPQAVAPQPSVSRQPSVITQPSQRHKGMFACGMHAHWRGRQCGGRAQWCGRSVAGVRHAALRKLDTLGQPTSCDSSDANQRQPLASGS